MRSSYFLLGPCVLLSSISSGAWAAVAPDGPPSLDAQESIGWNFVQNGTTGIVALEFMVVSPTIGIMFNRAGNDPLQVGNHSAWGALWDFTTNTASPLDLLTNSFCASGSFLSNGTMVSVGGTPVENPDISPDQSGLMGMRIFEPCLDPHGVGCTIFDDPAVVHLAKPRWYPASARIFDGSLMIVGGIHVPTPFFNNDSESSFEFFPPKDGGVPRPSAFLERSLPANLFPRTFALPDGNILLIANNQTAIYDILTNTETPLPDLPNGVRVTNPYDGTATLLPLHPPLFIPEVLVCGGTNASDQVDPLTQLSTQDPASDQCSRMTLTPEGIAKGWEVERMLEPRMMPEMILLPNGSVVITNGARTGYAAVASVGDLIVGDSNADHPVFTPSLYTPDAPLGQRISNAEMPTTNISRLYHSTTTLTPMGNIFLGGQNPHGLIVNDTIFPSEFRAEYLNPPFMSVARPQLLSVPSQVGFNERINIPVSVPDNLQAGSVKAAMMDLGFSTHAFHSSQRLVFMESTLSNDRKTLSVLTPPNNRVYPPGPAFIFLTIDDVTSEGAMVMVGNGMSPPVADQGVPLPL